MTDNTKDRDPEILELSREIHNLTGQMTVLLDELNKTVVLLTARAEKTKREGIGL